MLASSVPANADLQNEPNFAPRLQRKTNFAKRAQFAPWGRLFLDPQAGSIRKRAAYALDHCQNRDRQEAELAADLFRKTHPIRPVGRAFLAFCWPLAPAPWPLTPIRSPATHASLP